MTDRNYLNFISNIETMFKDIEEHYQKEKDPLARCELAKGYLALGEYLANIGNLSSVEVAESFSSNFG